MNDECQIPEIADALHGEIAAELARVASLGNPRIAILAELERDRSRVNLWTQTCDGSSLCTCCCLFPVKPSNEEHYYLACETCVEINRIASRTALADPLAPFERRHDGVMHLCTAVDPDDEGEDFELRDFADFVMDWCVSPEMSLEYRCKLAAERAITLPEGTLEWPDVPSSLWRQDVEDPWAYCVAAYLACVQELLPGVMHLHPKLEAVLTDARDSSFMAPGSDLGSSH